MINHTQEEALTAKRANQPRGNKPNADLMSRTALPKNLAFGRPRTIKLRTMQAVAETDRPSQQPTYAEPYQWTNFYTHAQIDEWVQTAGLTTAESWSSMTLAEKKFYLIETYGTA